MALGPISNARALVFAPAIGAAVATAAVPVARVAAVSVAQNVAYRWPAIANLAVTGASLLWFDDAIVKLVGTKSPNTDVVSLPASGQWGLADQGIKYVGDREVEIAIKYGPNPDGHDCIGILPVFYQAPAEPTRGMHCSNTGNFPTGGATYIYTWPLSLSESAQPTSTWAGWRVYTCKSDGTAQNNCLPGDYNFVIQHQRNITVGDFPANPERRISSIGTCRSADGIQTPATPAFSPTYTQGTGSGTIVRPTCPEGSVLVSLDASLQTKNINNTWITTIPDLYTTSYIDSSIVNDGTQPCTGINQNCAALSPDVTSATAPVTTTITYPDGTTSASTGGTTDTSGCNISLNIASTALCVLEKAFIPTQTQTQVNAIKTSINNSAIGTTAQIIPSFIAPFTALANATPSTIDCRGPAITLPFVPGTGDMYPFTACTEPNATASQWVRTIMSIVVIISSLYLIAGVLLSSIGARASLPGGKNAN
jgi:hypothetical protein